MRIFCRVIVGVPSIGLTLIAFLDFQFAVPSGAHTCLFISRLACFLSREIISGGRHVCTGRGSRIQAFGEHAYILFSLENMPVFFHNCVPTFCSTRMGKPDIFKRKILPDQSFNFVRDGSHSYQLFRSVQNCLVSKK